MSIVKDKKILKKLDMKKGYYAVYSDDETISSIDEPIIDEMDTIDDIDNSQCDAQFETVSEGYTGNDNYMKGVIKVLEKDEYDLFPKLKGIYDRTGTYMMESTRGVTAYLGRDGKARCIAIPQCKMCNSTVFDDIAEHKIYMGYTNNKKQFRVLDNINLNDKNDIARLCNLKSYGTHVSFDKWIVIGAIFGKALRVWRSIADLNYKKMPTYMFVSYSEIYEALVPNSKFSDLSDNVKYEWIDKLSILMKSLNKTSMLYDLPNKDKKRTSYISRSILENTWVKRRACTVEEENKYMQRWGEKWIPYGVKVRIRGNFIFDFCWRNKGNSPSVVQLRPYDYDGKKIFGKKGWKRCFNMIYASWLVQYRNFWIKHKKAFSSCELVWSQKQMLKAFEGSIFDIEHLSTEEMCQVLDWYSVKTVALGQIDRPAHIDHYEINKRCELSWELPKDLSDANVILKNENGMNISMKDSGITDISDEVKLADMRMKRINEENKNHIVTLDGNIINTMENVIYRMKYDKVNKKHYIEDNLNGRCYSMKGGVQSLRGVDRLRLKIDGNKVKEVDYSSLHPHMLYALNGLNYKSDNMYDVGRWYLKNHLDKDEAKKAVKMMMLRMINARNTANALHSFKKAWNEEHHMNKKTYIPWLMDLFNAIKKAHSAIAHEFCTGKGTYLMNLDGKLIREVEWRLTREKICVLGVHDSVVVEEIYANKAMSIMKEEYEKMFNGFTITAKMK